METASPKNLANISGKHLWQASLENISGKPPWKTSLENNQGGSQWRYARRHAGSQERRPTAARVASQTGPLACPLLAGADRQARRVSTALLGNETL